LRRQPASYTISERKIFTSSVKISTSTSEQAAEHLGIMLDESLSQLQFVGAASGRAARRRRRGSSRGLRNAEVLLSDCRRLAPEGRGAIRASLHDA
jgi:hypothetical protein